MSFGSDFRKLCDKAGKRVDVVVRKTALELQSQMIEKSPVDTGRFKSNWQAGVGGMDGSTNAAIGSDALGRSASVLHGWAPGMSIFLTNSLPYAKRLENGWSQQAPLGMVSLTVQAYAQALKAAVGDK